MENTKKQILALLNDGERLSAKFLKETIGVSESLIHRHLRKLTEEGKIEKIGSPPKVWYQKKKKQTSNGFNSQIIEQNWLEIKANGAFLYGSVGFEDWCMQRNFDLNQKIKEFETAFKEKEKLKQNGLIEATKKINKSFETNFLEKVYYLDFYSLPIFGKTVLGKLILYAKQNSDLDLMRQIAKRVAEPLVNLIKQETFDMVAMIPHSVPRKRDFLSTTLSFITLPIPPQKIFEKVFRDHHVAQKTLKSKQERIENAKETLFTIHQVFPNKILLIDDACGSGSTINIAAQKIKKISPNSKIYALTFVGSQKGFEVIAES